MPSDAEFTVLEAVVNVLEPLSTLTDALSSVKQVTISSIHPVLKHILQSILVETKGDSLLAIQMKNAIKNDLFWRNNSVEVCKLIDVASSLDPTFKDHYLKDKETTIGTVKEECL